MRLIQMCNVGNIVGGTAACAWSVTRALPDAEHTVIFRSIPTKETRAAFAHCQIETAKNIERQDVEKWGGDFLLLHNISPEAVSWGQQRSALKIPVLQYAHSAMKHHAGADLTVACSVSLARRLNRSDMQILYQGVPCPKQTTGNGSVRSSEEFIVGRICTPCPQKWPSWLVQFYQKLSARFPDIRWEFVGCPDPFRPELFQACHQRATFHEAGWDARQHLNRWHVLLYRNPDVEETFGRTVAEAMRAGTVPIVDNAGGFCEQIGPKNGYLCSDQQAFFTALEELSSFELWNRMSACSRETADTLFSFGSFRQRLLESFERTVAIHSPVVSSFFCKDYIK